VLVATGSASSMLNF